MLSTLENLIKLARERKLAPVEGSYTNKLLTDKSLSKAKVLEEVDELIEANDVKIEEVMKELEKRKK
jgi:phosphoribosyl-ATP pyrophosphohydrolase